MKYNQFLQNCLSKAVGDGSKNTADTAANRGINQNKNSDTQNGIRDKIGLLDTEPIGSGKVPESLTPQQEELLKEVYKRFTVHKINSYLEDQIDHINHKRHIGESIKLLFDEHGKPPANAPLEDIIAARKKIEAEIHMLDAIGSAMRISLSKIREIEDMALESIDGHFEK